EIECVINDEYSIGCRQYASEVFLPFSFIARYFEVYGKLTTQPGEEAKQRFEWTHSYSRVYHPRGKYSHHGIFMSFEHYNVEYRDRVKCITGREEVPLSTQWGPQGYFYPIQIAQYGLSHFSKHLVRSTRNASLLEDAESRDTSKWSTIGDAKVLNSKDAETGSRVIAFHSEDLGAALKVAEGVRSLLFLSFDLKVTDNASVVVSIESKSRQVYRVHYVCSESLISASGDTDVYYGIGDRSEWSHLTRDLATDLHKGLVLASGKKKARRLRLFRVNTISFVGHGFVDNVTLASSEHLSQFYAAADWLVREQDEQGGWPIPVERSLADGRLQLSRGWYSAMAQGQAISLLVRAYNRTLATHYLEAALRATKLYDVPASQGGVLASFANQYSWYEEYPTTPSCFVLNGFMYALIALYDLKQTVTDRRGSAAVRLYESGMRSLKALLPLFDTGSGSIYDLRHFTLGIAPNLARWDYHSTHINQLLLLSTVDADPILRDTASRWTSYMQGHRAPHN
ncbi:hypothetical protein CAPTEDRAFT_116543, partial [Capitella teleta]